VTARDSDRDVRLSSRIGLSERSIYPVEPRAGLSEFGSAEPTGPRVAIVAGRGLLLLHERAGDALHALSREPEC
jgi:hypothetical protein